MTHLPDLHVPVELMVGELCDTAKYIFILMYNGYIHMPATTKSAARILGQSSKSTRQYLRELYRKGFIRVKKTTGSKGKKINRYYLAKEYTKKGKELSQKVSDAMSCNVNSFNGSPNSFRFGLLDFLDSEEKSAPKALFRTSILLLRSSIEGGTSKTEDQEIIDQIRSSIKSNRSRKRARASAHTPARGDNSDEARKKHVREKLAKRKTRYSKRQFKVYQSQQAIRASRSGNSLQVGKDKPDGWESVAEFGAAFIDKLRQYKRKPYLKSFHNKLTPKHKSYRQIERAIAEAESLGIDFEVYIEAQFFWFDKWFGRAPNLWELSGGKGKMPARSRAKAYVAMLETEGDLSPTVDKEHRKAKKLNRKDILEYNERLLQQMMSDGSTVEDCFLEFAKDGVFHKVFLRQHPVYKSLVKAGKL